MKKVMVSIVAVFAAMVLVLGMAGCGGSEDEKKLNAFIASEDFQEELKDIKESAAGTMNVDVKASGNKLCFEMKLSVQIPDEQVSLMKTEFESSLAEEMFGGDDSMNELAEKMKEETGVENAIISVEIKNADGSEIFKTEIDPSKSK